MYSESRNRLQYYRVPTPVTASVGWMFAEGGGAPEEAPATALFVDHVFSVVEGRLRLFSEGLSFRAPGCVPVVVSLRRATRNTVASVGIVDTPEARGFLLLVVKVHGRSVGTGSGVATFASEEAGSSSLVNDCSIAAVALFRAAIVKTCRGIE